MQSSLILLARPRMYVKTKGWVQYSEEQLASSSSTSHTCINPPEILTMLGFSTVLVPKPDWALTSIRKGEVGLPEVTLRCCSSKMEQAAPWDTFFPPGSGRPVQTFPCKALQCKGRSDLLKVCKGFTAGKQAGLFQLTSFTPQ